MGGGRGQCPRRSRLIARRKQPVGLQRQFGAFAVESGREIVEARAMPQHDDLIVGILKIDETDDVAPLN
jgi:hypothetical protein